jgi:hypothetical protein
MNLLFTHNILFDLLPSVLNATIKLLHLERNNPNQKCGNRHHNRCSYGPFNSEFLMVAKADACHSYQ